MKEKLKAWYEHMNVINILVQVDNTLSRISVNGDDVFALADARKLMKLAFDELNKPPEEEKTEGES